MGNTQWRRFREYFDVRDPDALLSIVDDYRELVFDYSQYINIFPRHEDWYERMAETHGVGHFQSSTVPVPPVGPMALALQIALNCGGREELVWAFVRWISVSTRHPDEGHPEVMLYCNIAPPTRGGDARLPRAQFPAIVCDLVVTVHYNDDPGPDPEAVDPGFNVWKVTVGMVEPTTRFWRDRSAEIAWNDSQGARYTDRYDIDDTQLVRIARFLDRCPQAQTRDGTRFKRHVYYTDRLIVFRRYQEDEFSPLGLLAANAVQDTHDLGDPAVLAAVTARVGPSRALDRLVGPERFPDRMHFVTDEATQQRLANRIPPPR